MKKENNVKKEKNMKNENNVYMEKSTKKDKNPYNARIDLLRAEFSLSNLDVDGMKRFLESPTFNKKNATARDLLNTIIDTDKLNVRQKMALSYSIGMFQVENNVIRVPMILDMTPGMTGSGG